MKVLVTGGEGQVASALVERLKKTDLEWRAPDRSTLNITSESSIENYFLDYKPEIIINTAAYTAVDKAESDIDSAYAVNALGPGLLATYCQENGSFLIHLSTDYVFDGQATTPYLPDDPVSPQSVYGKSKFQGEENIRNIADRYLIIRTAWVFSEYGSNFFKTMLRLAQEREVLKVVNDQKGAPTYAGDIADILLAIVSKIKNQTMHSRTLHFTGNSVLTWYEFACLIIDKAYDAGLLTSKPNIQPVTSLEFPTPAKRPKFSVLDSKEIYEMFSINFSCLPEKVSHLFSSKK